MIDASACCIPIGDGALDQPEAERFAALLKVLADPARLRIVSILASAATEAVCVCDLTDPLGLSQPTVSHHIKQLREAGLIVAERRGKWVYHRLVPEALEEVRKALMVPAAV